MLTRSLTPRALPALIAVSSGALIAALGCGGSSGTGGSGGNGSGGGSAAQGPGSTSSNGSSGAGGASSASSGAGGGGGLLARFPDTTKSISVLADQLPNLTAGQQQFAASHFVGTQKLTLALSQPLRAINPKFIVLHYHLAMWQSAPGVDFILDGKSWGNDYPTVDMHESWFWHNTMNQRVASSADGKLLMNVSDAGFQGYWTSSLIDQVEAGQYDGIFLDSASPALLQGEAKVPPDPRIAGTGVKDNPIPELGNKTFIQAWEQWISALDTALAQKGIPLIPNTSAFTTTWDNTDYSLTAGIFSEGYADPSFVESDWKASTSELLSLAAKGKVMILQNYLGDANDVAKRIYYLANYLLVKGNHTYIDYFAKDPLEWYPEWGLDLGGPLTTGMKADDLAKNGVYRRDFEKGTAIVNPSDQVVTVSLGGTMQRIDPVGGGQIDAMGNTPGSLMMTPVTSVDVAAKGAVILLK